MFIQCCRTLAQDQSTSRPDEYLSDSKPDLFIAWAFPHLSPAYRSPTDGSWFPKALHDVVMESLVHHHDLQTIMHSVTNKVCVMMGMSGNECVQQCPELVDRLRYNVSFHQSPK